MKLYMIPECPFVHRVLLACDVRKVEKSQMQLCHISLSNPPPTLLGINSSGSVPTLEFEDGRGFHESLVIMEFLDSLNAGGAKIFGANPRQIAETKVLWEAANQKLLAPVQKTIYNFGNVNHLRSASEELKGSWQWLEGQLQKQGTPFFGGNELNAIDIGLAPFLVRLPFIAEFFSIIPLPSAGSKTADYLMRIKKRCDASGVFPNEEIMRETTLKFSKPHQMFIDVQNAPRILIEDPRAALAAAGTELSAWGVEPDSHGFCLKASFKFPSHTDAVKKLHWLHDAQETCDHHTSFTIRDFSTIDILLVTHEPRWGVTQKDLTMAKLLQAYFTQGQLPS